MPARKLGHQIQIGPNGKEKALKGMERIVGKGRSARNWNFLKFCSSRISLQLHNQHSNPNVTLLYNHPVFQKEEWLEKIKEGERQCNLLQTLPDALVPRPLVIMMPKSSQMEGSL